jgi:riboflavin kinase/FMN adenylyltransferase
VYRSLDDIGPEARGCTVSIGNFDGVHAGHRQIFRRNIQLSHEHGWIPSALTFHPHPARVVAPARAPHLLTTIDQRIELIRSTGIEQVFVLPFDKRFSQQTPEEFVRHVLVDAIGAKAVLVGENFHFGKGQAGHVDTLTKLGAELGFSVEAVPPVTVRGRVVSSTEVRHLIEAGAVSFAARLLERPYGVEGEVVRGFGIGSKQTVPTLNLRSPAEVLPAHGVYITYTEDLDEQRAWRSITNVGTRPTFDGDRVTIETFLLSKFEGETPSHIRVQFLRRVRDERKFESPEALKSQILKDVGRAQAWFRRFETFRTARSGL